MKRFKIVTEIFLLRKTRAFNVLSIKIIVLYLPLERKSFIIHKNHLQ